MTTATVTAPTGAMQFEVNPSARGLHEFMRVVWVLPPVRRTVGYDFPCRCRTVFPVIESLIPGDLQPALARERANRSRNGQGDFYVCDCMGKVIE